MADDAGPEANVLPVLVEDADPLPDDILAHIDRWTWWYRLMFPWSAPATVREYQPESVDLHGKSPSFLDLAGTAFCGCLLALILMLHFEIYSGWLTKHGYLGSILQLAGKALVSLVIAISSTLCFEIIGTTMDNKGRRLIAKLKDCIYVFSFRRFGWVQILDNGQPFRDANGQLVVNDDPTGLPKLLLQLLADAAVVFASYSIACATTVLETHGMTPAQQMLLSLGPRWTLQAVDSPGALVYYCVVPYCIQFMQSVFLWLLGILFMAKADRFILRGHLVRDPKYELLWSLAQATNIHLIWLTAYQMACDFSFLYEASIDVPSWWSVFLHCQGPWRLFFPEGSLMAGISVLCFNSLQWNLSLKCARLLLPIWLNIIKWQTSFSQMGIDRWRVLWHEYLVEQSWFNPVGMRPNYFALLWPWLFGLKSSWPSGLNEITP
ncbi:hypothetical protein F5Y18DRAFT_61705 [Xylariaceae sp. FL1019]|nr:hypothetical protein F5Y18DRAFT_61705 [Xylariaceae sp. FL1019]